MKTIEKLILCCIWICIAIVAVLIKDQADLNQKIMIQSIEKIDVKQEDEKQKTIILNETEVMDIVASSVPVMREASLSFSQGQIQMKVTVNDSLLDEADKLIAYEPLSLFLPLLKGMEVSCQAEISSKAIEVSGCKAGFLTVPEELIELVEQEVNRTWSEIVEKRGIEKAEVSEEGLQISLEQE